MDNDEDKKKDLLNTWLASFLPNKSVMLFKAGETVSKTYSLNQLGELLIQSPVEESIYILLINHESQPGYIPVYIGRAVSPLSRWEQHLTGLLKGINSYSNWQKTLLNQDLTARYDTLLVVVPVSKISVPPILEFPTTVGSVEYQLVGLASDAYPGWLLNREGNRR